MNRRRLLQQLSAMPLLASLETVLPSRGIAQAPRSQTRARPNAHGWPDEASWEQLGWDVEGRLLKVQSPLAACAQAPASPHCEQVFKQLKNPYYLRDEVGLTQSLGWVDAWTSKPSLYAVAAESGKDVVAAVNFARRHNLRLVVKGGGHSYQGTSNAAELIADLDAKVGWRHTARPVCRARLRRPG